VSRRMLGRRGGRWRGCRSGFWGRWQMVMKRGGELSDYGLPVVISSSTGA